MDTMTMHAAAKELESISLPRAPSHKGQNGKLLIIGGSHLFHSASVWALHVASRIVDLVHYASVPENNALVSQLKKEFRNGIVIPRYDIEAYIAEDDSVLIGPGMVRTEQLENIPDADAFHSIREIDAYTSDEGVQTYLLTRYLLRKYKNKQWVIDAGALQMMAPSWIPRHAILTPHTREFDRMKPLGSSDPTLRRETRVLQFAREHACIVLLKGPTDCIASPDCVRSISGGNAGMTKGGTGDVLSGLVAALSCTNDPFVAAVCGSYINKRAGDDLFSTHGYWFHASDLADQIPRTMKHIFLSSSSQTAS